MGRRTLKRSERREMHAEISVSEADYHKKHHRSRGRHHHADDSGVQLHMLELYGKLQGTAGVPDSGHPVTDKLCAGPGG